MILKDFFQKDITRNIETVIKADDRDHILDEVVEYVVTQEISRKIQDFFSAYKDYQGANGVWISGFFGSGKSHLLKILSYVLENKVHDGYALGELFAEKIEKDDSLLKADVLASTRFPSESILFNIDQQAQITSKQESDAILTVFYKVFYDHLGYFGAQRHIAEFERWLAGEGVYETFQEKYQVLTGDTWPKARRKYFAPKVKEAVAKILGNVFDDDAEKYDNIFDTLRKDNQISIDDFCNKVQAYIETKPQGFRLNFFVDEVGQYISDNTKLMLNLQTIAESLATKTKGQSWILVTSQEDIEKVVGDLNKSQQNDFSRIQARFKLKIPLTSANVDEVIEKRLLSKNDEAQQVLIDCWKTENANLKTLISFSEGGVQFKGFKHQADFVNKYPFLPFHFDLFQQCIRALSNHNAFQGKHASVGERSMLGVFQEVVNHIQEKDQNSFVSYDLLYDGIRSTIRGEIQNAITLAERNLDNDFAIRILKALFLVKYYTNFKTTVQNIGILMLNDIQVDIKNHEKEIQKALKLLESQTYIQRNGEFYEFLTDDEKDIEQEIKATDIDNQSITQLLKEIFFDEIIRDNKIPYKENKQEFEFSSKIDGISMGREKELTIEIITPNHSENNQGDFYKAQTMGYNTLMMVVLPQEERLLRDLRMYLRTDKYIKQNQSTSNKDNIKRILFEKGQQNRERKNGLVLLGKKLLGEADVYLNGSKKEMGHSADGKTKIFTAFQFLIKLAYPNLRMMGSTLVTENAIRHLVRNKGDDLFGNDDSTLSEAENEALILVERRKKQADRTSLADLKEHFTKKPYGWYPNFIWKVAAQLYKRGKVEARQNGELLDEEGFLAALLNNRAFGNTILEPQIDIDPRSIRQLKEIYREAFDETCSLTEGKEVALAFQAQLRILCDDLGGLASHQSQYPFLSELQPQLDFLTKLSQKGYVHYLTKQEEFEDELIDGKEQVLNPIRKFWNGEQKKIFDGIRSFINGNQSNLEFMTGDELSLLQEVYRHPKPYAGKLIKDAKAAKDSLSQKVISQIKAEKEAAIQAVKQAMVRLQTAEEFPSLEPQQQTSLLQPLEEELGKLETQRYIANIRQASQRAKGPLLEKQLNAMLRMARPVQVADGPDVVAEPQPEYVRLQTVRIDYAQTELKTEQDVEAYINHLRKVLLEEIKAHKRITL